MNCDIVTCQNEKEVIESLSKTIETLAKEAITANGVFRVGFSGELRKKLINKENDSEVDSLFQVVRW